MDDLRPYLNHVGNCGAVGSRNPIDDRCVCGLRQTFTRIKNQLALKDMSFRTLVEPDANRGGRRK